MQLNHVSIMGNLTRDPELKYIPSGNAVCHLSIANNRVYMKDGEKTEEVSFFDVQVWGVAGENCSKYLSRGSGVVVEGRLRQDRWEKDGKSQSKVRITANTVHFLPKRHPHPAAQGMQEDKSPDPQTAEVASEEISWEE